MKAFALCRSLSHALVAVSLALTAVLGGLTATSSAQVTRGGAGSPNSPATARPDLALLWPEIPWVRGADLAEFDRTIRQSRDHVRKEMTREVLDMLLPLAEAGAEVEPIIKPIFDVLMTFDGLHEAHKNDAARGLGVSLEAMFMAEFDNLFRQYDIRQSERRAMFANSAEFAVIERLKANSGALTPQQKAWLAARIRYLTFGTWTITNRGEVILNYHLEDLVTGERINFESRGSIEDAIRKLAQQVFTHFQENEYEGWRTNEPKLIWVAPSRTSPALEHGMAKLYCSSQNARLPYYRELRSAMFGSEFKPGGIPAARPSEIWAVADRRLHDFPYYFFSGQEQSTGGDLRTSAGQGTINAKYWCVRGEPSDEIKAIEKLYLHLRAFKARREQVGELAVQSLLRALGDSDRDWYPIPEAFLSVPEALRILRARGVNVKLPSSIQAAD